MSRTLRRSVEAPAKLNLLLAVGGRRADGFHELVSVMQTLDLVDRIDIDLAASTVPGGLDVLVEAPGLAGGDTLVTRAVTELFERAGRSGRAWLTIEKEIPVGAGLGGGSSDAAAALVAVNEMLGSPVDPEGLFEIAAGIGSDVPFFLRGAGTAAVVRGRGELLEPIRPPAPRAWLLLNPGVELPTAAVYEAFDPDEVPALPRTTVDAVKQARGGDLRNDLAAPARRLSPELDRLCTAIADAGGASLVCGSGSTVGVRVTSAEERRAYEAVARAACGGTPWSRVTWTTRAGDRASARASS